ncbi:hypothetical protein [Paractinoplanes brasiliensis]|uniref:Uncharacterized protein n=1 Tax=Paractinoplanes brasiliensis TaxID=52695 RepID=A0A4R6JST0_9ACTN|nr:hypothetical protein [Actinoplanes brasiliensis]TDO39773.1 hypothetical protein C8E87_3473 [Actinoplanes brasiliensis]GID28889.1 hypothetical protein Abr02nite_38720 [Actinoplanes brasiliensis]
MTDLQERMTVFQLERYKFILQQLHATNENVHRYLAIFQTIATTILGGVLAVFFGYKRWGIDAETARTVITVGMWLVTAVAAFAILQVIVGILSWLDYRREECDLLDELVKPGVRARPLWKNFYRWYETYVVVFILTLIILTWVLANVAFLPRVK